MYGYIFYFAFTLREVLDGKNEVKLQIIMINNRLYLQRRAELSQSCSRDIIWACLALRTLTYSI